MIVGDDQDALAMYAFGLLAMGFQPITAENAAEGFARARDFHADVIVTDVALPDASQLADRLRSDTRTKNTVILALTDDGPGFAEPRTRNGGFDRLLLKPCFPDTLSLEIREVLDHRRQAMDRASPSEQPK